MALAYESLRHRGFRPGTLVSLVGGILLAAMFAAGCSRPEELPTAPPGAPSILMFIYDTTRRDAVSAYGTISGTTPAFDDLAAGGLLFTRAYANAPWTLPSHVSLFTGLPVSEHEVAHGRGLRAPDDLTMLAERLQGLGYQTVGFSENPFVSEAFNTVQGFDHFVSGTRQVPTSFAAAKFVAEWMGRRDRSRPFFLFVNVMDAHQPYPVSPQSRFLPEKVSVEALKSLDRQVHRRICANLPPAAEIEQLRRLYFEGVATADAQMGAVLDAIREAGDGGSLVTIATSDHGEHFGEHRLMEHNFSVREALLQVPLLVAGLPGVSPAVIDAPVQLIDVVPTILALLGADRGEDLPGRVLPRNAGGAVEPPLIEAVFTEPEQLQLSSDLPKWIAGAQAEARRIRTACGVDDRVFGNMMALQRFPYKLVWFERHPPQLFDIASDPHEKNDIASARPAVVAELLIQLRKSFLDAATEAPVIGHDIAPGVAEQLRALGYIE